MPKAMNRAMAKTSLTDWGTASWPVGSVLMIGLVSKAW